MFYFYSVIFPKKSVPAGFFFHFLNSFLLDNTVIISYCCQSMPEENFVFFSPNVNTLELNLISNLIKFIDCLN